VYGGNGGAGIWGWLIPYAVYEPFTRYTLDVIHTVVVGQNSIYGALWFTIPPRTRFHPPVDDVGDVVGVFVVGERCGAVVFVGCDGDWTAD
jgi:hypothetical protein